MRLGWYDEPMTDLDRKVIEAISTFDEVSVLVIFGSRATGRPRPDSDLDIAVLPVSTDAVSRRLLQSRLAVALADQAPAGRVDVVFVDEAPDLLRQRIMESGRVLVCKDPALWREWRIRTMREFGDREPYRRLLREAQIRRLSGGEPGGGSGHALESLERTGKLPH